MRIQEVMVSLLALMELANSQAFIPGCDVPHIAHAHVTCDFNVNQQVTHRGFCNVTCYPGYGFSDLGTASVRLLCNARFGFQDLPECEEHETSEESMGETTTHSYTTEGVDVYTVCYTTSEPPFETTTLPLCPPLRTGPVQVYMNDWCPSGRELRYGLCFQCPQGFYRTHRETRYCQPCPEQCTTVGLGATGLHECVVPVADSGESDNSSDSERWVWGWVRGGEEEEDD